MPSDGVGAFKDRALWGSLAVVGAVLGLLLNALAQNMTILRATDSQLQRDLGRVEGQLSCMGVNDGSG